MEQVIYELILKDNNTTHAYICSYIHNYTQIFMFVYIYVTGLEFGIQN